MSWIIELKANNIEELRQILGLIFSEQSEHFLSDIRREVIPVDSK